MMSVGDLADAINAALGPPTDKDGNPIATTAEMTGYAQTVHDSLASASFAHIVGTVTGTAQPVDTDPGMPPGKLTNGTAINGALVGLMSGPWAAGLAAAFPGAPLTAAEAGASTGYLSASGKVGFASGKISGVATASTTAAGILANGAGADGKIAALVGSAWAAAVLSALGVPAGPLAAPVYTAVAGYIMAHADFSYSAGQVVGTFPIGAGALVAGAGAGGAIA